MAHHSWRGEDREPPNDCGANRRALTTTLVGTETEVVVKSSRTGVQDYLPYLQSSKGHVFQQAPRVC